MTQSLCWEIISKIRKHSSRMHTICCHDSHWGVYWPLGEWFPSGCTFLPTCLRVTCPGGYTCLGSVPAQRGCTCLEGGVPAQRGLSLPRLGVPVSQHALRQTPTHPGEQNYQQTQVCENIILPQLHCGQ